MGNKFGLIRRACALLLLFSSVSNAQMPGMEEFPAHKDMRWTNTLMVLFEQLEFAPGPEERPMNIDMKSWYGSAYNRLWVRGAAEFATTHPSGEAEAQILFGRLVDPFWDAVIGLRLDRSWGDASETRVQLATGFVGLAPYRFELEPTLFVSQNGDLSGRMEASFPLLLTQRLIAEPEIEVNAALQAVPKFNVRRGINEIEAGIRLRYEFRREFAPYFGWSRTRRYGDNHNSLRGRAVESQIVVGLRIWR